MSNFSSKRAGETEIFTVDFAPRLLPGETLVDGSAVWTITPVDGEDPSTSAMIVGSASISGTTSSQKIGGGLPDVRYAPICTVQTSLGQTLILPDYGDGQLEITP